MFHSVIFSTPDGSITKNTWEDWFLAPTSRPVFVPPQVKQNVVELPGRDGHIDISEVLTGYPIFSDRTGSIEFLVDNGHAEWHEIFTMVSNFLNGKMLKAVLEDDPDYYYEGRFAVNQWQSQANNSRITINYDVAPYKKNCTLSTNDQGVTTLSDKFTEISFDVNNQTLHGEYGIDVTGAMPTVPTIICTPSDGSTISYRLVNMDLSLDTGFKELNGTVVDPDAILYNKYPYPISHCDLYIKGIGTGTYKWQRGEM